MLLSHTFSTFRCMWCVSDRFRRSSYALNSSLKLSWWKFLLFFRGVGKYVLSPQYIISLHCIARPPTLPALLIINLSTICLSLPFAFMGTVGCWPSMYEYTTTYITASGVRRNYHCWKVKCLLAVSFVGTNACLYVLGTYQFYFILVLWVD